MFLPLRGDDHGINCVPRFQSIVLHHTSAWPPLTLRGALRHGDTLVSPVNFWVMMGKPQMSNDDGLLSEVGDHEMHFLCVLAISEYDLNLLHDGSILIRSSIDIVDWHWVWQGASFQLMLLDKGSVDKHPCCT